MHVNEVSRAAALVQIVDILTDHDNVAGPERLKFGQRLMGGVGRDRRVGHLPAAHIVEFQHPFGVAGERIGRRHIFDAHRRPDPIGVAKSGEPGFFRNSGAGEDNDGIGRGNEFENAHGRIPVFFL